MEQHINSSVGAEETAPTQIQPQVQTQSKPNCDPELKPKLKLKYMGKLQSEAAPSSAVPQGQQLVSFLHDLWIKVIFKNLPLILLIIFLNVTNALPGHFLSTYQLLTPSFFSIATLDSQYFALT